GFGRPRHAPPCVPTSGARPRPCGGERRPEASDGVSARHQPHPKVARSPGASRVSVPPLPRDQSPGCESGAVAQRSRTGVAVNAGVDQVAAKLAELRSERTTLASTRTREDARELAETWLAAACARMNGTAGLVLNGP